MDNKMKVMVFEVSPKFGKLLNDQLKSIAFVDLIENTVNNTEEALELILKEKPDIIILGNDFPGKDSYFFTHVIRKEAAPTQVIMIAEVISSEVVRQAMRAGACDFISYKNLTVEELSMAIERAGQQVLEERKIRGEIEKKPEAPPPTKVESIAHEPARIITVYSPKGGTGVSTITANLARVMEGDGYKVLVVDGDLFFGDMAVLLNQISNYSISDLVRFKENLDGELVKDIITAGNVDLLAAPSSLEKSLEITGPACEIIMNTLSTLDYDFLLINTSSNISDSTLVFLEKAESVILIGTQEISTVRALRLFLALMGKLSIGFDKFEMVINRYENDSILSLAKINESLDVKVSYTIPLDDKTVLHANNLGIPFVVDQKELAISKSIIALANYLMTGKKKNVKTKALSLVKNIKNKITGKRASAAA